MSTPAAIAVCALCCNDCSQVTEPVDALIKRTTELPPSTRTVEASWRLCAAPSLLPPRPPFSSLGAIIDSTAPRLVAAASMRSCSPVFKSHTITLPSSAPVTSSGTGVARGKGRRHRTAVVCPCIERSGRASLARIKSSALVASEAVNTAVEASKARAVPSAPPVYTTPFAAHHRTHKTAAALPRKTQIQRAGILSLPLSLH